MIYTTFCRIGRAGAAGAPCRWSCQDCAADTANKSDDRQGMKFFQTMLQIVIFLQSVLRLLLH